MQDLIKTKIIATMGPATSSEEKVEEMMKAGATIFRINSSHGDPAFHKGNIEMIRKKAKELNLIVTIVLDLQGPKIRVGKLLQPMILERGNEIRLTPALEQSDPAIIPVDYKGIVNDVKKGDRVLLNDGRITLEVKSKTKDIITAKVIYGGELTSRKGLNIPGTTASLSAVTERDVEYIKFGVENDVDYIALSFVREKDDIMTAKKYIQEFNGDIPVIAKIEKPQALDNLKSIIIASDGVMVARGDLGIEISPEKVPIVQKQIIEEANSHRKAVITATQMLESMINEPMPTRAEASDVANAIIDGTDAVMLSGETAVGNFPGETIKMMSLISENVEASNLYKANQFPSKVGELYEVDSQAVATAVIRMLTEIEINAIVAFTRYGFTGRLLSKAKPSVPIIAISDKENICRRLNLFWGVFPYLMRYEANFSEAYLKEIDKALIKKTFLNRGDKIIITGGLPCLSGGRANFLRLHQVGSASTLY